MYQKLIVEMSYYNLTFMGVGNEYTNLSFRSLLGKLSNKPCDIKQMSNQICLLVPHILNVTLLYELQRDKPSDQGCEPSSLIDRSKTFSQGGPPSVQTSVGLTVVTFQNQYPGKLRGGGGPNPCPCPFLDLCMNLGGYPVLSVFIVHLV